MSQIEISVPDTLLYQLKTSARREGVSLEQLYCYWFFRLKLLAHNVLTKEALQI